MTIAFTDRRCTVDVNQTAKDFSFVYGGKKYTRSNEKAVHNFFLKEYQANKLDTVKLRYSDASYYLHFTLDEPEKCTKPQLRAILARECEGVWCEEKNGNKRYFVQEGWLFPKIRELTQEQFAAYRPSSTIQKAMELAMGALSLAPTVSPHARYASGISTLIYSLLNANPTLAQMPAIGEFRINTNTTNFQQYPTLAALNDGGFVVAWRGVQTGNGDIYGQKYDATGVPSVTEFRINTNTTNNQQFPAIAALNNGSFIAVWEGSQTGDNNIYGQRFDAAATPVESEFLINTNTTNSQRYSSVVALRYGGFVVAWQGSQIGDNDIFGQRYNSAGAPLGSEFRINTNTTNYQLNPKLAALNDGGFVVSWHGDQTGDPDIYGKRYSATGAPVLNFSLPSPSLTTISSVATTPTSVTSESTNTSATASSSMISLQIGSSSNIRTSSSSQSPIILSIIELTYGTDYSIEIDGVNVGTFAITGGTGLYDGAQSNTLILQLDPDADLIGQTITLFTLPSGDEGDFQTIELQGVSCLGYDTQIDQTGPGRTYQITLQATTCSTSSKPEVSLLPTNLRV